MKTPNGAQDVFICFSLPFLINLPDTLAADQPTAIRAEYRVASKPPAGIHIFKRLRSDTPLTTALEVEGGDPFGRFSWSQVQIRFNFESSPELVDCEQDQLVEYAVAACNLLISVYRDICNVPLLRRLAPADIAHFSLCWIADKQVLHRLEYATGHGPLRGRSEEEMQGMENAARARLARGGGVHLTREMELQMFRLFAERDARGALLQSALVFETWLRLQIREALIKQGLRPDQIEAKFKREDGRFHQTEYIAKTLVREVLGIDFAGTAEYRNWREQTAEVRNQLLHGSREDVSLQVAERSILAARAACIAIERLQKQ